MRKTTCLALGILSVFFMKVESQNINHVQGIMDLGNQKLFVNLTAIKFNAENETSIPTLFTVNLPSTICDYWYDLSNNSQYIFSFEGNESMFIFDESRPGRRTFDSIVSTIENRRCTSISNDVALELIGRLSSRSYERDIWLEQHQEIAYLRKDAKCHLARCNGVIFVFMNMEECEVKKIIDSFCEIRPHGFMRR